MQPKHFGDLETKWHPGICVCASDKQYNRMNKGAEVEQVGKGKATVGCDEERSNDEYWKYLHVPSGAVVGMPTRPSQKAEHDA